MKYKSINLILFIIFFSIDICSAEIFSFKSSQYSANNQVLYDNVELPSYQKKMESSGLPSPSARMRGVGAPPIPPPITIETSSPGQETIGKVAASDGSYTPRALSSEKILNIDFQNSNSYFKLNLESNDLIGKYDAFFLNDPLRYVIDVFGKWQYRDEKSLSHMKNEFIQKIRLGEHEKYLRIVFDLIKMPNIFEKPIKTRDRIVMRMSN